MTLTQIHMFIFDPECKNLFQVAYHVYLKSSTLWLWANHERWDEVKYGLWSDKIAKCATENTRKDIYMFDLFAYLLQLLLVVENPKNSGRQR
jgi:hypothetical protein